MKVSDRCDYCGAQAFVEVSNRATEYNLMFCAHHFHKFELPLMIQNFRVIEDTRHLINVMASQSSA